MGKLAVYTAAAGIHPERAIAVNLDCGTNNELLLNDPDYLGNRHSRIRGERYDEFIAEYLRVAAKLYPKALLHFEDFGPSNARRILVENRDKYRIFNDDMQGTGAIVMAAVVSGLKVTGQTFADQRLVVYGAGTAGTGMADQIHAAMVRDGLSEDEARRRVWLIDRNGLVTDDMPGLPGYQAAYARPAAEVVDWERHGGTIGLLETVKQVKPTILIGTSTDHGAFTREVIETMSAGVERPIVLPLSNPTERIEAMPSDVIAWSKGRALVAVGIPRRPVYLRRHDLHHRAGQQCAAVPRTRAGGHCLRRQHRHRRHAAGRCPGGRGTGRSHRARCRAAAAGGEPAGLVGDRRGRGGQAGGRRRGWRPWSPTTSSRRCRTPCGSRSTRPSRGEQEAGQGLLA